MQSKIVQLRQLLREKFPGLRLTAQNAAEKSADVWPTGLAQLDSSLGGGFPKSAMTEIIAPRHGCGSATLLVQLLRRAASANQFIALIDGQNSSR